jgi:DNA-binding MarR family transcriptional regulator
MTSDLIGARIAALYELQSAWLEPRLADIGVTWTTFQLLAAVTAAGRSASQIEVARRLGVTPATLSEAVFQHVKRGLLEQVASPRDRRVKVLRLTPDAKAVMRQIKKLLEESESLMTAGIAQEDSAAAARFLDRLRDNLQSALRQE